MRLKWIKEKNVTFRRGNHRPLIAHLDNSPCWFESNACMTTQMFRDEIRSLAQAFGAHSITLKYLFDEEDQLTEAPESRIQFFQVNNQYVFRRELPVPEGHNREFLSFSPQQIFQYE